MSRPTQEGQFERLDEDVVFRGRIIRAGHLTIRAPDGHEYQRDYMHHPGAVGVVPMTDAGTVLLVRQYRPVVDRWLLEIPAGTRDVEGEDTLLTAHRELAEEVGMTAGSMEHLNTFYNSVGVTDEETVLYLARNLTPTSLDRQGVEEQLMTVEEFALSDVDRLIREGVVADAKTILGLTLTVSLAAS